MRSGADSYRINSSWGEARLKGARIELQRPGAYFWNPAHSQADRMVICLGCIGSGEKGRVSGQIHFEDRANRLTDGFDVKGGERKEGDKNDATVFA